jgi:hypothetical protein
MARAIEKEGQEDRKAPAVATQVSRGLSGLPVGSTIVHPANPARGKALAGVKEQAGSEETDPDPEARLSQPELPVFRHHR